MMKRGLTLVNAMHITASVFINDDADQRAVAQPHGRGQRRRSPEAERNYQLRVMGREVVVAVTSGRLDFGTWERIFSGQTVWLARES